MSLIAGPDAVLASAVPPEAAALRDAARQAVGLTLCGPVGRLRAAEITPNPSTDPAILAQVVALVRAAGLAPVCASTQPVGAAGVWAGLFTAWFGAAEAIVASGTSPWAVDQALKQAGFLRGPFLSADIIGHDKLWLGLGKHALTAANSRLGAALCASGRLGRGAVRGVYAYRDGKPVPTQDEEVAAILADLRRSGGGPIPESQIAPLVMDALARAGAVLLAEGQARRAVEVDVLAVHGLGLARTTGGPMHWADQEAGTAGLLTLKRRLSKGAEIDPTIWAPVPLIDELIKNGQRFGDLNDA